MCLPALGGRIKVEIDEFEKPARAHMHAIPHISQKIKERKSATKTNNGIET